MLTFIKKAIKYTFVGGFASVVDLGVYTLIAYLLGATAFWQLAIATTGGFIVGLVVNYILSLRFVWKQEAEQRKGNRLKDFLSFTLIGLGGLLISYGVLYLIFDILGWHYLIAKILAMGLSLVWNFIARHFFVFSGKDNKNHE